MISVWRCWADGLLQANNMLESSVVKSTTDGVVSAVNILFSGALYASLSGGMGCVC